MNPVALYVRHQAKPGMREQMRAVWEKHVKPRAAVNPGHLEYFFCHDDTDPDVVMVFQLYRDQAALDGFLAGDWYPAYLAEVAKVVAEPPRIVPAALVWRKEAGAWSAKQGSKMPDASVGFCCLGDIQYPDRPELIELFTDPEVRAFLGGPLSEKAARERAEGLLEGPKNGAGENSKVWAVRRTSDQAFIGLFWLEPYRDGQDHAVSYVLLPRHQGVGHASTALQHVLRHAFDDLKLPRVVAETQEANERSIRLLGRAGMRPDRYFERFGAKQVLYALHADDFRRGSKGETRQ